MIFVKTFLKYVFYIPAYGINIFLKNKKYFFLYRFGDSIGDHVCMTGICRILVKQYDLKVIVVTNRAEVFLNNIYIYKVVDVNIYNEVCKKLINIALFLFRGSNVEIFSHPEEYLAYMKGSKAKISLYEAHSKHFNYNLDYKLFKNNFNFSISEAQEYKKKFQDIDGCIIIQGEGKVSFTPNKEWGYDNFDYITRLIGHDYKFVQVGMSGDRLLTNVIDFRGKTSLRELFYIVSRCRLVLSNEGVLNHISSAFGRASIVVYTGFSMTELADYDTTISIQQDNMPECYPCYLTSKCDNNMKCISNIEPNMVVKKVKRIYDDSF
jgi:hypothetical protein